MTPPVFVLEPDVLADASVGSVLRVSGPEGRHAVAARRLAPGEPVDLVDGKGRRVHGVVAAVADRSALDVTVRGVEDEPRPRPRLTVVQALAKGDRGELAVELLTEIGVDEIVPWAAAHSVARWSADRAERGWRRWSDASVAAAKQSRRARFPVIAPMATTAEIVARAASAGVALVLHEAADTPLTEVPVAGAREVLIVVGPEGGIAPEELVALTAAGARAVRLGPEVLRTSSAGMAAAAVVLAASGRWAPDAGPAGPGGMGG